MAGESGDYKRRPGDISSLAASNGRPSFRTAVRDDHAVERAAVAAARLEVEQAWQQLESLHQSAAVFSATSSAAPPRYRCLLVQASDCDCECDCQMERMSDCAWLCCRRQIGPIASLRRAAHASQLFADANRRFAGARSRHCARICPCLVATSQRLLQCQVARNQRQRPQLCCADSSSTVDRSARRLASRATRMRNQQSLAETEKHNSVSSNEHA